jgi:hypothetical protein
MIINGKCHCGNVRFTLAWEPDPIEIPTRACDCSFCSKHGGVWTSYPKGALKVMIDDAAQVSPYRFGTGTAQFHICARCGVVPVASSQIDDRLFAVVNVNTFDPPAPVRLRAAPVSFDGETEAGRLARRRRNWIGDVEFVGAGEAAR